MFALEVEFLMGKVYAGDYRDRTEPEWPPHPARLFSALASACFETGASEDRIQALRWLEAQSCPEICAEDAVACEAYSGFVPNNYVDKHGLHTKQPRQFPAAPLTDARAYFIWREAQPAPHIRAALDSLAARVPYLGKSASFVRMRIMDSPPRATHVPSDNGNVVLRVPFEGKLDELKRLYQQERWDASAVQQRYRRAAPESSAGPESFFSEMVIFRRRKGHPLTSEATLTLTGALRSAVMAVASDLGDLPSLLHGHGDTPHCAFVALPFTGNEFADGRLMGCAILVPRERDNAQAARVFKVAATLNIIVLGRELGRWEVELADEEPLPYSLQSSTWRKRAKVWKSVTPVLLDQFPKRKLPVEEIIARSCDRVGLPRPAAIVHGPYSDVPGVPPVPRFRLLRAGENRPRWGVHANIEFTEPVQGPLALGAGRHFGLGLFKPMEKR